MSKQETYSDNDSDSDSDSDVDEQENIMTQITTSGIGSIYSGYLTNNKLLLSPEYQRDLCWSVDKMCIFIDTIMKGWVVPNYVLYKLSRNESQKVHHSYECIDGQHRLTSIKWFIEGIADPRTGKYVYWKFGKDENNKEVRVFYNMHPDKILELRRGKKGKIYRNFTKEELDKFSEFQMSIHMLSSQNGISIGTKCNIFNRLQNGEKIASYEKLKNLHTNVITNTIRTNSLLKFVNDIKLVNKLKTRKSGKNESFTIYFLIRTFLILDKKSLDTNYLDLNIKKYLEANNGSGAPCVQIKNDIDILLVSVKEIITYISNHKDIIEALIPELAYLYICIYANYGVKDMNKVIKWFNMNEKQFNKFNESKSYNNGTGTITSYIKMKEHYDYICNSILKKNKELEI